MGILRRTTRHQNGSSTFEATGEHDASANDAGASRPGADSLVYHDHLASPSGATTPRLSFSTHGSPRLPGHPSAIGSRRVDSSRRIDLAMLAEPVVAGRAAPSPPAATLMPAPAAPTLAGIRVGADAATLAEEYKPLLRAWWQAAHTALFAGLLNHDEIMSQDFAAMQRVMGLALLDALHRRWLSGCGPSGRLSVPALNLLPAEALRALQEVHAFVVTRPQAERVALIDKLVEVARAHIIAGQIAGEHGGPGAGDVPVTAGAHVLSAQDIAPVMLVDESVAAAAIDLATRTMAGEGIADMSTSLAATLFQAATAGALAARATQTVLLGVFWKMLEGYSQTTRASLDEA